MYQHQNNILSIPAKLLYDDWGLMSYDNYLKKCQRAKLIRTKSGQGEGNQAWISYYDLPQSIKAKCIKAFGDPKKVVVRNVLEDFILPDNEAIQFFASHRTPKGKPLSQEKQIEKATSAMILNAIKLVFEDHKAMHKAFGRKSKQVWMNVSEAVNALDTMKWNFSLPGNPISLKRRFVRYQKEGYSMMIHRGEGSVNAAKISGEIADFLLSHYALPNKPSIPEVKAEYIKMGETKNWPGLSDTSIYTFLNQPENKRIWIIGRHGSESYNNAFKHTLTRDKSNWFPNCFWSIDGTKLDWIHVWDDSSNKMGAKLKIDIMFDVYSEKIIGYSLSFSESHLDHFKAVKMAVNEAKCRPYYLTYDHQSGHKMKRMQELYSGLVAEKGGVHHPNKVKSHNNPAEQIFKRLQQQVVNKFWWSDGQSITVKRDDNKVNIDFINENKAYLKTVDELYEAWETAVNIWNDKKHPKFNQTRNEVFAHQMPKREELQLWDIMDKMWIDQKERPITYKAHGMDFWLKGDKYMFEVYDSAGEVDLEFRRTNIGKKFIIRYDPEFLDGYIQLCEKDENGNIIHIANAQPKRKHENVPALMKDGDKELWARDQRVKELEYERDMADYKALIQRTNITPETLIADQELLVKFKGDMSKVERSKIESEENIVNDF